MFDDDSFEQSSFDIRSWFFDEFVQRVQIEIQRLRSKMTLAVELVSRIWN